MEIAGSEKVMRKQFAEKAIEDVEALIDLLTRLINLIYHSSLCFAEKEQAAKQQNTIRSIIDRMVFGDKFGIYQTLEEVVRLTMIEDVEKLGQLMKDFTSTVPSDH